VASCEAPSHRRPSLRIGSRARSSFQIASAAASSHRLSESTADVGCGKAVGYRREALIGAAKALGVEGQKRGDEAVAKKTRAKPGIVRDWCAEFGVGIGAEGSN